MLKRNYSMINKQFARHEFSASSKTADFRWVVPFNSLTMPNSSKSEHNSSCKFPVRIFSDHKFKKVNRKNNLL